VLYDHNFFVTLLDGKPPLHQWFVAPFLAVLKSRPLIAGRLASGSAGALTTVGMFLLGRDLKDSKFGAWAALLYVLCPFAIWYDRLALTESLMVAIIVFSIYFAIHAAVSGNLLYLIGTGITAGLALLTKGTALVLFPVVPFAYVLKLPHQKDREKAWPQRGWVFSVAFSLLLGYGIYSLLRLKISFGLLLDTSSTRTLSLSYLLTHPLAVFPRNVGAGFRELFIMLTPVFFVMCFAGLILGLAKKWRPSAFLCIWFIVSFVMVSATSKQPWSRFFLVALPPMLFGAALIATEFAALFRRERKRANVTPMVAIALVVLILAAVIPLGVEMERVITDPAKAWLPSEARTEFIDGWTAGRGIEKTAYYLDKKSQSRKITVYTNHGLFPGFALDIYFYDNPNIEYWVAAPLSQLLEKMRQSAKARPTYCVLNDISELPAQWPLIEIKRFHKGKGKYMFLARYDSGNPR